MTIRIRTSPYTQLYAQYDRDTYSRAVEFFRSRGVSSMGYSQQRRQWSLMAIGRNPGPTTVILWLDLDGFIAALDAPHATLKAMYEQGANVRP